MLCCQSDPPPIDAPPVRADEVIEQDWSLLLLAQSGVPDENIRFQGAERTWRGAGLKSASDPKQTWYLE